NPSLLSFSSLHASRSPLEPFLLRSRTSVLNLPIRLRHRFFFETHSHSAYDRALPSSSPRSPRVLVVRLFRCASSCVCSHPPRGHAGRDPFCSRRRLLLQLRAIQNKVRLRENVRNSEVRFPLVGYFLRQTSRFFPIAKQRSRPPPPSSRPR